MPPLKAKRFFFVADTKEYAGMLLKNDERKMIKGLIRIGHDVQSFNYRNAFLMGGTLLSMKFARHYCKTHFVDELLARQIKAYNPDVVVVRMVNYLDGETVRRMRQAAPNAFFIGSDNNLWPEMHDHVLDAAANLDLIAAAYDGTGLDAYRKTGVRCVFLPSVCDPDIERRCDVAEKWRCDIMFTGKERLAKKRRPSDNMRYQLLSRLAEMPKTALYGCFGRPWVDGIEYVYAVNGAKIGLSVNAVNDIRLYHSDRLVSYLSCGTFTLAMRVPDSDLLFKDGAHIKYFDSVDEFFELANWYLKHDEERKKIADAGMRRAHEEFSGEKIAGYLNDLVEKGSYTAPWT
jgi:glycosyltransferase involved in cell wall biosynthesis